jgi:flagellar biosynthesis protein FlhG
MSAPNPAAPSTGQVIAVASGKGGVGKTWFAVTLAQALAWAGRRVLLFDGDLGLANVDVQLGLLPAHDLGGVIAGRTRLEEALSRVESGVAAGQGGFDVLAGRSASGALAELGAGPIALLAAGLRALAQGYDAVIVDLAAGIAADVTTLCALGGPVLVVLTEEPTSLTDAYALVNVLLGRYPGLDLRVVVNAASSRAEGERSYEALCRACARFLGIAPPLDRRDRTMCSAVGPSAHA